jgi:predicted peptidase
MSKAREPIFAIGVQDACVNLLNLSMNFPDLFAGISLISPTLDETQVSNQGSSGFM